MNLKKQPPKVFDTKWALRFSLALRVCRVAREDSPVAAPMPEVASAPAEKSYRLWWGVLVIMVGVVGYHAWATNQRGVLMLAALESCGTLKLTNDQCGDVQMKAYFDRPWLPGSD